MLQLTKLGAVFLAICIGFGPATSLGAEKNKRDYKDYAVFSGFVVSVDDKPIPVAAVDINGTVVRTDEKGHFGVFVKRAKRFVFNIRKPGFALVSRVYTAGIQDKTWVMTGATTVTADPSQAIFAQDTPVCQGPLSSQVDWTKYPLQRRPRYLNSTGRMIAGEYPPDLKEVVELIEQGPECSTGLSVQIPANSLVDATGTPPTGKVQVSVSTVDLFAPDSMPGDFTVIADGKKRMYMRSTGAGTVQVTAMGRPYQLKKGMEATLTIPIDPAQLKMKQKPELTIPFLVYDEKQGVWLPRGTAKLNEKRNAYVATIDHLSAFNTDFLKTDPSCVKFTTGGILGSFQLEASFSAGSGEITRSWDVTPADGSTHAIFNLPNNTNIVMRPFKGLRPLGTYMANTGDPHTGASPPSPNYGVCNGYPIWEMTEIILESCEVTNNSVCLRWTSVPNAFEYQITYQAGMFVTPRDVSLESVVCSPPEANTACYALRGLSPSTTYTIKVLAHLQGVPGNVAISNEIIETTSQ